MGSTDTASSEPNVARRPVAQAEHGASLTGRRQDGEACARRVTLKELLAACVPLSKWLRSLCERRTAGRSSQRVGRVGRCLAARCDTHRHPRISAKRCFMLRVDAVLRRYGAADDQHAGWPQTRAAPRATNPRASSPRSNTCISNTASKAASANGSRAPSACASNALPEADRIAREDAQHAERQIDADVVVAGRHERPSRSAPIRHRDRAGRGVRCRRMAPRTAARMARRDIVRQGTQPVETGGKRVVNRHSRTPDANGVTRRCLLGHRQLDLQSSCRDPRAPGCGSAGRTSR